MMLQTIHCSCYSATLHTTTHKQDGTPQSDRAHGIASAGPGKYVITGDTFGSYAATNKGGWDMVAALLTVTK
jgi:hypothetical protein